LADQQGCLLTKGKINTAMRLAADVVGLVKDQSVRKMNAIWLEVTGCSGNIISLLNSENPVLYGMLTGMVNFTFNNTFMGVEGDLNFERFLETLDTEFILLVDGAVSANENGPYNIVANYKGKDITALEAIRMAGEKAKYVVAVGTCASYGAISAEMPNSSESKSVQDVLNRSVIRLPGCPCHPDWILGTLAHLIGYGIPELDCEGRPILFYGVTIHDTCKKRDLFDSGVFANKIGEVGCIFKLGCRGPITRADCARRKWIRHENRSIGDYAICIGCARSHFPDGMEPFIR